MTEASVVKISAGEVKDGWPVRVYRKTEQHGWQRMKPSNSQGRTVVIRASPRSGCVVLPRIQVRIRLLTSTREGSKGNDAVVVRRRNALLVSSRSRVRSLVFKFSDLQSCLDFSDRLIDLNPCLFSIRRPSSYLSSLFASAGLVGTHRCTVDEPDLSTADSQQFLSLVGRLLCDEDFEELCHNLESSIRASEDGMQMLATLIGFSDAHRPPDATNA
jgi:hypothetical protein